MLSLIEKITKLGIGWNERPLDESDFHALCSRFNVQVMEMPLEVRGLYYRVMGRDRIAVSSRLTGHDKTVVLFHELGHFLFHTPESGPTANFHRIGRRTRKEREADTFALCAVIPRCRIENCSPAELIDEGFSPEIIAARRAIYQGHGL
jgi:Zn-dependent peptidase ImmA (M78 family)